VATTSTKTKHAGGFIICIFADINVYSTKFFSALLLIHRSRESHHIQDMFKGQYIILRQYRLATSFSLLSFCYL